MPSTSERTTMSSSPRIGLALGSGAARGWSHIGVIRALEQAGIVPEVVCGTSIGALVGAAYAAERLPQLETWVRGLTWTAIARDLIDWRLSGGLIQGAKLIDFFRSHFEDKGIEALPRRFACVATELTTGREVWLQEGSVIDAVRASVAVPGLLTPVLRGERLLVDGGLVNPVPVSLCRALGAEIVIAVDLNWDLIGRRAKVPALPAAASGPTQSSLIEKVFGRFRERVHAGPELPSVLDVLTTSLNVMQVRITQSRLAGEPADVLVRPRLSGIAAMDFHRAAAAIAEGERAGQQAVSWVKDLLQ